MITSFAAVDLCQTLCGRLNWEHPLLRDGEARQKLQGGDAVGACLAWIKVSRSAGIAGFGLSKEYIRRLRAQATDQEKQEAAHRWEKAMERELYMPFHRNTFAALGAETFAMAATRERFEKTVGIILSRRSDWSKFPYLFGVTHSISELLHHLWPMEECADECMVPVLAWMLEASDREWKAMRGLTEAHLGTSGHNWYAHSFLGFFMAGCFIPELANFARFKAFGRDYLEREVAILFDVDGWSKEGAAGYHEFAAKSLYELASLAHVHGVQLSRETQEKIRLIADTTWRTLAPNGTPPGFGDDGGGGHYEGHSSHLDPPDSHLPSALRARAAAYGNTRAKWVLESLFPKWRPPLAGMLPWHGHDLLDDYRALAAREPDELDTRLGPSGLYVMRQDWTPRADYAAIIAGPLGNMITSHKHSDLFTMELYSRGRRILVDNGYGSEVPESRGDPRYRMWRVSSAAHNIATVDDLDAVSVPREFRFGEVALPTVDDWRSEAGFAYLSMVHEGYRRPPIHVAAYRRKLFYLRAKGHAPDRGGYWIVIDRFTPEKPLEHEYQLHFHLAAQAKLLESGRLATQGAGGNLLIVPVDGAAGIGSLSPNPFPIKGYENPQHLCYRHRTAEPWTFITLLVPFEDDRVPEVQVKRLDVECDDRILLAVEATALGITINGKEDVYFDQHRHWNLPWKCGGHHGRGRLFHSAIG